MVVAVKFPLPRDFFRCPDISPKELEYYTRLSHSNAMDVALHAQLDGGAIEWTLDVEEPGLKMYAGFDPAAPPEVSTYCSVTDVAGTLDEAASLFRGEGEDPFRMGNVNALDNHILYTFAAPSPENPRHSIHARWIVLETPIKGLGVINNRDICILESHHDVEVNNHHGWVRSVKSIDMTCCPPLDNILGLVRASIYRSGHIVVETDRPGILRVTHFVQIDLKLNIPSWMRRIGLRARCRDLINIDLFLRELRLSQGLFLSTEELLPKESRIACPICNQNFWILNTKTHCRKCGEVVCRNCSKKWTITLMGTSVSLRICTSCSLASSTPMASRKPTSTTTTVSCSPRFQDSLACGRFIVNDEPVVRIRAHTADDTELIMEASSTRHRPTSSRHRQTEDDDDDAGWFV
ncbi:unnamed protein product [Aphanomyces euteiches]